MTNQLKIELRQLEFLNAKVAKISEELYKDREEIAKSFSYDNSGKLFASIEWVNKYILQIPEKKEILKVKDWKKNKN